MINPDFLAPGACVLPGNVFNPKIKKILFPSVYPATPEQPKLFLINPWLFSLMQSYFFYYL